MTATTIESAKATEAAKTATTAKPDIKGDTLLKELLFFCRDREESLKDKPPEEVMKILLEAGTISVEQAVLMLELGHSPHPACEFAEALCVIINYAAAADEAAKAEDPGAESTDVLSLFTRSPLDYLVRNLLRKDTIAPTVAKRRQTLVRLFKTLKSNFYSIHLNQASVDAVIEEFTTLLEITN